MAHTNLSQSKSNTILTKRAPTTKDNASPMCTRSQSKSKSTIASPVIGLRTPKHKKLGKLVDKSPDIPLNMSNPTIMMDKIFLKNSKSTHSLDIFLQSINYPAEIDQQTCVKSSKNTQLNKNNEWSPSNDIDVLISKCGNGDKAHIYKCSKKKCALHEHFVPADRIVSSVTHRVYDCVTPPGTTNIHNINCHSSNLIYLITCKNCMMQYIGETGQTLYKRFGKHRGDINNSNKRVSCRTLADHFNIGLCKDAKYMVQIVEKLDHTGRTERNVIDTSHNKSRSERELHWMLKLRTVYPYGLNDKVGTDWHKNQTEQVIIGSKFPKLDRQISRHPKGNGAKMKSESSNDFLNNLKNYFTNDLPNTMNFARQSLFSMTKSNLKKVATKINDILTDEDTQYKQWYLAILDIIKTRIYKPMIRKTEKKFRNDPLKIFFTNKAVEMINMPKLLHTNDLEKAYPKLAGDYKVPTVVYTLAKSIHSSIFNYSEFVESLDIETFIKDSSCLPCSCDNSAFRDDHHNHIITGNLDIVQNPELRQLLMKGPKYREAVPVDFSKARGEIVKGIDGIITTWSTKKSLSKIVFKEWKIKLIKLLDERIKSLSNSIKPIKFRPLLKQHLVKETLNELHEKYVITPVDKASGNVAIICKRFYAQVLLEELNINATNENTYEKVTNKTEEQIIKTHITNLKKFKHTIDVEMKKLPLMYWIPKIHKTPTKSRFIVAGVKCTVKPLAKSITTVLKKFYEQIENYNKVRHYYSGVKTFWCVQNKDPILDSITSLNERKRAKSVSTFDFSTLYTKIPHDKLIEVLDSLIDFCWKGYDGKKIVISNKFAKWSDEVKPKENISFTNVDFKKSVSFLLNNCFFKVGKSLFRQKIGIPMGSDPAPFMANLFLYFYENQYMRNLEKTDNRKARCFGNVFRYIDDLDAMNDGGLFEEFCSEIYPHELELKKENNENTQATFLDLDIKIKNKQFITKLYDKRDDFPFAIVRMPYLSNNMPRQICYSTIGSEILRIAKCTSENVEFIKSSNKVINRMKEQGAVTSELKITLVKTFKKHKNTFAKFYDTSNCLVNALIF